MSDYIARLVPGPREGKVTIEPEEGQSLRQVERILDSSGLLGSTTRSHGRIYMDVTVLVHSLPSLDAIVHIEQEVLRKVEELDQREVQIKQARRVVRDISDTDASELLEDFPEKSYLDPHQVQAVAIATHPDVHGLCLFDEQGLGKTVEALFTFHRLRQLDEVSRMLIFCPKSMAHEWAREAHQFFDNLYTTEVVLGTDREKRKAIDRRADVVVTNFETAASLSTRLRDLLKADRGRTLLVVDESFFVKNPDARRTRALRMLRRHVKRCIVLCGTPAPNSPADLVEQFNIADGGAAFAGVHVPDDREAARAIVGRIIEGRGVYLRRLKDQVLTDLPAKSFNLVLIPLQPQQRRLYYAALNDLVQDLLQEDDVSFKRHLASFIARRSALLQICSYPASIAEGYTETPAKLIALDSILEEVINRRREKVIVWSFFTASIEAIHDRYSQYNPVRFDGKVSDPQERRDSVSRFQNDDETMLFIGNPAAAGAGLTLHRACVSIYESMSNQAAHYLQSLDRIHRRGQSRPVEYIVLVCDQTIELHEYQRLLQKQTMAQDLLNDNARPSITRQAMLDDAIAALRMLGDPSRFEAQSEETRHG